MTASGLAGSGLCLAPDQHWMLHPLGLLADLIALKTNPFPRPCHFVSEQQESFPDRELDPGLALQKLTLLSHPSLGLQSCPFCVPTSP